MKKILREFDDQLENIAELEEFNRAQITKLTQKFSTADFMINQEFSNEVS